MKADLRQRVFFAGVWLICVAFQGCSLKEAAKKIVGTSTQTLEDEARLNGISRSFQCSYQDCFEAVAILARQQQSNVPWEKIESPNIGDFDILMSDLYSSPPYIIVVGIKGSINTTEVGIFFDRVSKDAIRVSISSLSSMAKRTVADIVFAQLEQHFQAVE